MAATSDVEKVIHKVVLTGGPCAGKTTTLTRVRTFFENHGWKVYMVPESATILLGGGVKFNELNLHQVNGFQENIVKTIMQIEQTYFDLAERDKRNCLIVCDRGTMDPSAFCSVDAWKQLMKDNDWDFFMLRDNRYDQIIHMVTAAKGAESFYQLTNNSVRSEGIEEAREKDLRAAEAWVGHPYCDVIDNSTDFENKLLRVIDAICKRADKTLTVNVSDALKADSKKRKFLVKSLPDIQLFGPRYQDFDVQHDYLLSSRPLQSRIRKRGQNGSYSYTLTERTMSGGKKIETLRQITKREYETLLHQADEAHHSIVKTRRCFHWSNQYYQLDIFKQPQTPLCKDLYLLETYTTNTDKEIPLPSFLEISHEVTDDPKYSMFNLSQKNL